VLSDVHGNPWALRAALEDVRRVSVDLVVNCGDLVAGPWPTEVVEELLGCGLPVLSVRGNGDRMVADASDGRWDDVPPPRVPPSPGQRLGRDPKNDAWSVQCR